MLSFFRNSSKLVLPSSMVINLWECMINFGSRWAFYFLECKLVVDYWHKFMGILAYYWPFSVRKWHWLDWKRYILTKILYGTKMTGTITKKGTFSYDHIKKGLYFYWQVPYPLLTIWQERWEKDGHFQVACLTCFIQVSVADWPPILTSWPQDCVVNVVPYSHH